MNIHYIQKLILMDLAENDSLSFAGFKRALGEGVEKDSLNYHIKTLISKKLVTKTDKNYSITTAGKKFISNLDFDTKKVEKLTKVSVMVGVFRQNQGKEQILLAKRLKAPFLNSYSLITGKMHGGEFFEDTAKREVEEESGLIAKSAKLVAVRRLIDTDINTGEPLIDVMFMMFRVDEFEGELVERNNECENVWVDVDKVGKYELLPAAAEFAANSFNTWDKVAYKEDVVMLGKF